METMTSIHSYNEEDGSESVELKDRYDMSDVFTVFDEERNEYRTEVREFKDIRNITSVDKKIFELLGRCPLIPTSTIRKVIDGKAASKGLFGTMKKKASEQSAYERVKVLFDNGYISRFDAKDIQTGFVKSVFYLSSDFYDKYPSYRQKGMVSDDIGSLSVTTILEMSQLSRWCAFAMLNQPGKDVRFKEYRTRRDAEEQYTELIMEKGEFSSFWNKGYRCRFHVISAPKDDNANRLRQFMAQLYHYDEVCEKEMTETYVDTYSYVVIVCENIPAMEHLAANVEHMIYENTSDKGLRTERFLYSLEIDGDVSLGAFKFLHRIGFPKGSIVHDQVGFK